MTGLKEAQLEVILRTNPMLDDIHLGIRTLSDIKTFAEALQDLESVVYPDFSRADAAEALKRGTITVYSSKAINPGDFVSTSRRMAQDYAGHSGRVNQRTIKLTEVAWINGDEGVYTGPIKIKEVKKMSIKIESSVELSKVLEATLSKLVSKYYPSGVIEVSPDLGARHTGVLSAKFTPEDTTYAPLEIGIIDDKITRLGSRFNRDTDPKIIAFKEVFKKAQARVLEKAKTQPAPAPVQELVNTQEGTIYTSPKGVTVENRYGAFCGNVARALAEAAEEYSYPGELVDDGPSYGDDKSRQTFRYRPDNRKYADLEFMCYKDYVIMVQALSIDDFDNKEVLDYQEKFYKRGFLRNLQANHPSRDGHIYQDIIAHELMETKKPLVLSDSLKKNIKGFTWLDNPEDIEALAHSLESGYYNPNSICGYAYMNLPQTGKFSIIVKPKWGNLSREFIEMVQRLTDKYSPKGRIYAGLFQGSHCLTYIPEDTRYPQLAIYTNGKQITNFHPVWQKDLSNPRWQDFEYALKQAKEKQAGKQEVLSAPNGTVEQIQHKQAKPQLPTIDISKFSGVGLPNSAYEFDTGNTPFDLKGKPHRIVVKVAQTQETSTAYLKITLSEGWTGGRIYQHRFMGKSPTELIRKLEAFLSVPAESLNILLDETYYEDLRKSSYAVNARKTANFLAQCPIKK